MKQVPLIRSLVMLLAGGVAVYALLTEWRLETDILALLPEAESDATVRWTREVAAGSLGRSALFLVSHPDSAVVRTATRELGERLEESPAFSEVLWNYGRLESEYYDLYFPLRYQVLAPSIRRILRGDSAVERMVDRVRGLLFQPTSALVSRLIPEDPLLLFPAWVAAWRPQPSGLTIENGILVNRDEDGTHGLINALLSFNPYEEAAPVELESQWREWKSRLESEHAGLRLRYASAARYAEFSRASIKRDVVVIGCGSVAGITILLMLVFRSLRQLLLSLLVLGFSVAVALGAVLLVFHRLHAVALAFGISLVGVCIDFGLHYFTRHRLATDWEAWECMHRLAPAIALGGTTTIVCYGVMAATPLVGLRQIALIAVVGILMAMGVVTGWLPLALQRPHALAPQSPALFRRLESYFVWWQSHAAIRWIVTGALAFVAVAGWMRLKVDDSSEALNRLPEDLAAEESALHRHAGTGGRKGILVFTGQSEEQVLRRMEEFHDRLESSTPNPPIESSPFLTRFVPSRRRQEENRRLLRNLLREDGALRQRLEELGIPAEVLNRTERSISQPLDHFLTPEEWRRNPASRGLRQFWIGTAGGVTAAATAIREMRNRHTLDHWLESQPGIFYLNPSADLERLLGRYRRTIQWLYGPAVLAILVFLMLRRGPWGAVVLLPPLLAALMAPGFLGIMGEPLTLMHCLALLLILGMGMDYAIFFAEADHPRLVVAAVTMSALTTAMSFGLLAVSRQPILHAIGITTLTGIVLAWWLSPLGIRLKSRP